MRELTGRAPPPRVRQPFLFVFHGGAFYLLRMLAARESIHRLVGRDGPLASARTRRIDPMAKVRKAVITAAGRGTRQYPASRAVQKELFPLVDRDGVTKPVLQIIGEEAIDSGIEELCIVTPPGQEP